MAKWGEGDPRWIVEEREDCRNVNNWHWTEKNATSWSQKRIKELLTDTIIENDDYECKITEVSKCEGDAVANNRKAKLIFLYEWVIECKWEGNVKKGENKTKYEGKIEVPNLSDENTAEELDVTITCDSTSKNAYSLKDFMHKTGSKVVKEKLGLYIQQLREEFSKGLILPSKNQQSVQLTQNATNAVSNDKQKNSTKPKESKVQVSESSGPMSKKPLEINDEFFCAPDDLYRVLTTQDLVSAFSRSQAKIDAQTGGKFEIWSGNVTGTFTELTAGKLIAMDWRRNNWSPGQISKVRIELESFDRGTRLKLIQTGVLEKDLESIRTGWHVNYFQAIKQIFGYGGSIY